MFGDGTVIIKHAPGHSEGHQLLYVKLAQTGGVVLSGDLYHYPEERSLNRLPTFDVSEEQTRDSRAELERFLERERRRLVDSARPRQPPQAEEGARVLRVAAICSCNCGIPTIHGGRRTNGRCATDERRGGDGRSVRPDQ